MAWNVRISSHFLRTEARELPCICRSARSVSFVPPRLFSWAVEGNRDPSFNTGQVLSVPVPYHATTDSIPTLIGPSTLSNNAFLAAVRYGTYPLYTVRLIKILGNGTLAPTFGVNGAQDGADARIDWGAMTTLPGPDTILSALGTCCRQPARS